VHGAVRIATDGDAGEIDAGDAAKVENEPHISIRARDRGAEVLLVETRAETGR
jgi:hypothetical protein